MRKVLLVACFALPAACSSHTGRQPVSIWSVPPGSKCVQSTALATYVGQPASTDLAARLMGASQASKIRWVPHGSMITMDHSDIRLTVRLDQQNRVISASCG